MHNINGQRYNSRETTIILVRVADLNKERERGRFASTWNYYIVGNVEYYASGGTL